MTALAPVIPIEDQPTSTRENDRDLPKGIYYTRGKKLYCLGWDKKQKLTYIGTYDTVEEAEYRRRIAMSGHHWDLMPEDRSSVFGFCYVMTHRPTGQKYLGSKQLMFWDGPIGGWKATDVTSEHFDSSMWKDSDWAEYKSSSVPVAKAADDCPWDWDYEVISTHRNRLSLRLAEVHAQIDAEVLTATDANGDYAWLNGNIMGAAHRPPVPIEKLKAQESKSLQEMKEYYLKPSVCKDCGTVVPFGSSRCINAPLFGGGTCNETTSKQDG